MARIPAKDLRPGDCFLYPQLPGYTGPELVCEVRAAPVLDSGGLRIPVRGKSGPEPTDAAEGYITIGAEVTVTLAD